MKSTSSKQFDLFEHIAEAYAQPVSGKLANSELYRMAAGRACIDQSLLDIKKPIGQSGVLRSLLKREIRWHQQTLRQLGLIEKVYDERGVWQLTESGKSKLRKIRPDVAVLGFSTDLGMAIWSNCNRVFENLNEPIFLALTSPPYPLKSPRAYGNPDLDEYVDFICKTIEPIIRNLIQGGNIVPLLKSKWVMHHSNEPI